MRFDVKGAPAHAATGGRQHVAGAPWIVFLHGAGSSHLTWVLQSRSIAYDGWNVLAPDLPGHNLTPGKPIADIAGQAEWVLAAMDAAGCGEAVLAGHSMGGLIVLEIARRAPERVRGIVFVATAAAIPVNDALIQMAETEEEKAFAAMNSWAFGPDAHMHDNTWPGGSHVNFGIDMMRLNAKGTLAVDLKACAAYSGGLEAASIVSCPTLCVFAEMDRMTPVRAGGKLAAALPNNRLVVLARSGHTIPTEKPRELNAELRSFLAQLD